MHVHIINEWNVLCGPAEGTVSQEWRIARIHDRQWRKEKAQYFITQEVPPKCNYMYPQYWNIPPGFLAGETSSQQSVPRSTWRYQDICVHIYRWCVRALNARQYATLPRLTPTECHVAMHDVWVFPAHPSLCAALPDLTAAVLSSLVTAALPNGR